MSGFLSALLFCSSACFNTFVLIFDGLTAVVCACARTVVVVVAVFVPSFVSTVTDSIRPCADRFHCQSVLVFVWSTRALGFCHYSVRHDVLAGLLLYFWSHGEILWDDVSGGSSWMKCLNRLSAVLFM